MRDNSGSGESKNNNHNPTLKEHERAQGGSGEAIAGEQKVGGTPSRKSSREGSNAK